MEERYHSAGPESMEAPSMTPPPDAPLGLIDVPVPKAFLS